MEKLSKILRDEYQIEMPMIDWQGRDQRVKIARISVQGYTSQEEVDAFVDAVMARLGECQVVGGEGINKNLNIQTGFAAPFSLIARKTAY